MAMIAPIADWMFSVVPREPEREDHAGDDGRHGRNHHERKAQ